MVQVIRNYELRVRPDERAAAWFVVSLVHNQRQDGALVVAPVLPRDPLAVVMRVVHVVIDQHGDRMLANASGIVDCVIKLVGLPVCDFPVLKEFK